MVTVVEVGKPSCVFVCWKKSKQEVCLLALPILPRLAQDGDWKVGEDSIS